MSIARCLAVAISHAPGPSGTPRKGHCSSAITRASCASSSAAPTSPVILARPAIRRGDLIRHNASIADLGGPGPRLGTGRGGREPPHPGGVCGRAGPAGPVVTVQLDEARGPLDGLLLRPDLVQRVAD